MGVEVLAVAIDVQGSAKVRPYVEQAGATYLNAVDTENRLSLIFGFKAVPNVILVDDAGIIRYTRFGGFDIRNADHRRLAEHFVSSPDWAELERQAEGANGFRSAEALEKFQDGLAFYRQGHVQAALGDSFGSSNPKVRFIATDGAARFEQVGRYFIEEPIDEVELVDL